MRLGGQRPSDPADHRAMARRLIILAALAAGAPALAQTSPAQIGANRLDQNQPVAQAARLAAMALAASQRPRSRDTDMIDPQPLA